MDPRIELKPDPSLWPPRYPAQPSPGPRKRRSVFGRLFRGVGWLAAAPIDWIGVHRIARSASLIRATVVSLRTRPRGDTRFKTEENGDFDLKTTAFRYRLLIPELQARLSARRRQTKLIAYASVALAWAFLLAWVWQAMSAPLTPARIASALNFLPFCVLFFLVAFYNALLNYQIRTGRMACWREYLLTGKPFWPR